MIAFIGIVFILSTAFGMFTQIAIEDYPRGGWKIGAIMAGAILLILIILNVLFFIS